MSTPPVPVSFVFRATDERANSKPLVRGDLDDRYRQARMVHMPGAMGLRPVCHPDTGLVFRYSGDGLVHLDCAWCFAPMAVIKVAER